MRPVELEKQMLIPQYSTSRLIDRLVHEGPAARRGMQIDKRGQFVEITEAGGELQQKNVERLFGGDRKHVGLNCRMPTPFRGLLDWVGLLLREVKAAAARDGVPAR
jgi:DNA-binding MarR family transcriptional regulator